MSFKREDGRRAEENRPINIIMDFVSSADGSVLIECGRTRVLCNATLLPEVPKWLQGQGKGWVTAEYSLLPQSTDSRVKRERKSVSGRTQEIQRLIGRSLRAGVNLEVLGERALIVDCDVIEADGGTRTTSIVGGFIALALALKKIKAEQGIEGQILQHWISAVSVGLLDDTVLLDLCYVEEVSAGVDMNIVMADGKDFVEVQGTGEGCNYSRDQLNRLLDLGEKGCGDFLQLQKDIVGELP